MKLGLLMGGALYLCTRYTTARYLCAGVALVVLL